MIESQNLTKIYDGRTVVNNLSFKVSAGEIFGFLVPNGAGKTTTIKMLLGLVQPTSGMGKVAGFDIIQQVLDVRKSCGVLPDPCGFYYTMTAREALKVYCSPYGHHKLEQHHRRQDRPRGNPLFIRPRTGMFSLMSAAPQSPFSHNYQAPVDVGQPKPDLLQPQILRKLRLPLPGPYHDRTIPDLQTLLPRVEDNIILYIETAGRQPRVDSLHRLPGKNPVAALDVRQAGSITIENRDCSHEADIAISIMNITAVLHEGDPPGYQLLKVLAG